MKQQQEGISGQKTPISNDIDGKKKLTRLVTACYEAMNVYGKSPEQLEAIIMLMQMTLRKFSYDDVRKAFEVYLNQSAVMPTPADIVKIIEPSKEKRKWCATTFIDLRRQQREGQFMSKEEKKYMHEFVAAKIEDPDNASAIESAMKQVEAEDKRYYLTKN